MGVTVQQNIHLRRWALGRNMLEPDSVAAALQIQHQRPGVIKIAIAPDHQNLRTKRAQFIEDLFRADIAEVPDLVRRAG